MAEHPFMPVRTSFHTVCLGVKHPSHRGAPWCNGMLHGATVRQRDVGFAFCAGLVTPATCSFVRDVYRTAFLRLHPRDPCPHSANGRLPPNPHTRGRPKNHQHSCTTS